MLSDYGKEVLKSWFSIKNVAVTLSVFFFVFLAIVRFDLNSSEVASWVQAVGSVAAIVAAAFIPIWHERVSSRKREEKLVGILRVLTLDAQQKLWLLSSTFMSVQAEVKQMQEYLNSQRQKEWGGLVSAVAQIPIAELPPLKVEGLGILRDAVSFGEYVAGLLPTWIEEGSSHPDVVVAFRGKRDLLDLIKSTMPNPSGFFHDTPEWVRTSQYAEMRRPDPNPIYVRDVKIYRRYSWDGFEQKVPSGYQLNYYFPNGSFERAGLTLFPWESIDQLEESIKAEIEIEVSKYYGDF